MRDVVGRPHRHVGAPRRHRHGRHGRPVRRSSPSGLSGGAIAGRSVSVRWPCSSVSSVLGPVIARPFTRVLGAPLPRLRGHGRHARSGERDPQPARTCGNRVGADDRVGLVAFITVFAASTKASINDRSTSRCTPTGSSRPRAAWAACSPDATQALDALPETGARHATAVRTGDAVDGFGARRHGVRPGARGRRGRTCTPSQGDLDEARSARRGRVAGDGDARRAWRSATRSTVTFAETGAADVHGARRSTAKKDPTERLRHLAGRVRRQRRRRTSTTTWWSTNAPGVLERSTYATPSRRCSTSTRTPR